MCYLFLGLHIQNVPEKADLAHRHRTSGIISLESGWCKTVKGQPDWCRHTAEFSAKPSKISSSMDGLPTHQMSISEKGAGVAWWQVETWNSGMGRKGASHRHWKLADPAYTLTIVVCMLWKLYRKNCPSSRQDCAPESAIHTDYNPRSFDGPWSWAMQPPCLHSVSRTGRGCPRLLRNA